MKTAVTSHVMVSVALELSKYKDTVTSQIQKKSISIQMFLSPCLKTSLISLKSLYNILPITVFCPQKHFVLYFIKVGSVES